MALIQTVMAPIQPVTVPISTVQLVTDCSACDGVSSQKMCLFQLVMVLLRIFSQVRSAGSCSFNPGRKHSGSLQIYSDDQCTTTLSLTSEHHHHSEVRTTQGHSHYSTADAGAPYIGPRTISRTFLIIPENSGTLYRRPFLGRSRQHEISREAARHFRNVPNCAIYRNYAITE